MLRGVVSILEGLQVPLLGLFILSDVLVGDHLREGVLGLGGRVGVGLLGGRSRRVVLHPLNVRYLLLLISLSAVPNFETMTTICVTIPGLTLLKMPLNSFPYSSSHTKIIISSTHQIPYELYASGPLRLACCSVLLSLANSRSSSFSL